MLIAALLAGLLLWLTFGTKAMRDQRNWPPLGAIIIGIALLAKAELIPGLLLIGGGALWLRRPKRNRKVAPRIADSALIEARDLLGLGPDADRKAILAAHRRLIARNHPDSGGTEALAARLNAARDLLLKAAAP